MGSKYKLRSTRPSLVFYGLIILGMVCYCFFSVKWSTSAKYSFVAEHPDTFKDKALNEAPVERRVKADDDLAIDRKRADSSSPALPPASSSSSGQASIASTISTPPAAEDIATSLKRRNADCQLSRGVYHFLDIAAQRYQSPEVSYVQIDTGDMGAQDAIYSMVYDKRYPLYEKFVGVDFASYKWAKFPPFQDFTRMIVNASYTKPLINKAGWYGNIYSPRPGVPQYEGRPRLYKLGQEHPDILDIHHNFATGREAEDNVTLTKGINMVQLVEKYSILVDIGGIGYSARLKYLLFSGRPLLLVDRWHVEWFNHLLVPFVHYIPVEDDLSNLVEQTRWCLAHPTEAQVIADNAQAFAIENFSEDALVNRAFYAARNVIDARAGGMRHFLGLAAAKKASSEGPLSMEVEIIPLDPHPLGSEGVVYTQAYDKRYPEREKYCGVGSTFHRWWGKKLEFERYTRQIMETAKEAPRHNKVSWCGYVWGLHDFKLPETQTLPQLLFFNDDIFNFPVYCICPKTFDGQGTSWPDLIRSYSILLDIGDYGFSSHLKFLLYSGRPILLVDRHFVEWYNTLLVPYIHYVPVEMDLSNLREQAKWIMEHKEEAQKIADNALAFALENFTQDKLLERTLYAAQNVLASLQSHQSQQGREEKTKATARRLLTKRKRY